MATNKVKGLTASDLMRDSNRQIVKALCDDLVQVIDGAIQSAHKAGVSKIEHELPVNFNINGMERQDAQILIYSELIMMYVDKGHDKDDIGVEFQKGGKVLFHVRWINGMTDEEREKRKKIIQEHIWAKQKPPVRGAGKK